MNHTGSLRWRIALLIAAAIAISYFDRQTLPVAIKSIQLEIPISNTQFSQLQAAFLTAYALMYAGGGKLVDVLGTRMGFLLIMAWWSVACASHGLATGFGMLVVSRFLLGMGEGGGFPAATKAVAEWFPVGERSTAMGIINAGTSAGAVVAPPLIAITLATLNWRWVFFLSGAAGLAWTIWWLWDYFPPADQPRPQTGPGISWLGLFRFPQVWGLVSAKFLSDAAWYFYLFWLPKYLYDMRHFDTKQVGYFAWIPYAAAGIGSLLGGWFSSRLIQRGRSLNFSRKLALGAQRGGDAAHLFRDAIAGRDCHRAVQHRVCRAAILVHPGDDSAGGYLPAPRGGVGGRAGGLRRGHGRRGVRPGSRLPARPRLRLWRGVRHR